jgi:hypothetical protein
MILYGGFDRKIRRSGIAGDIDIPISICPNADKLILPGAVNLQYPAKRREILGTAKR